MKKFFICLLTGVQAMAYAQSLIPEVVHLPVTGFMLIRQENPYVLVQRNASPDWENMTRYTWKPSMVHGFLQEERYSVWEDDQWTDAYLKSDSVVTNNEQKVTAVLRDVTYNYMGTEDRSKSKYLFSYDDSSRLIRVTVQSENPAVPGMYKSMLYLAIGYDQDGKRAADTTVYLSGTGRYVNRIAYDPAGKVTREVTVDLTKPGSPDTVGLVEYTYINGLLATYISSAFDQDLGRMISYEADSFFYNTGQQIAARISYGRVSMNGQDFEFLPFSNESYHYTNAGKLDEIVARSWEPVGWTNANKYTIMYSDNKAVSGFIYETIDGTNWETSPSQRLVFNEIQAGLNDGLADLSGMSVFPNPAKDHLNISFMNRPGETLFRASLYDHTGKIVLTSGVNAFNGMMVLDIQQLKAGIYYLRLEGDHKGCSRKIVIRE